jgi:hypothetical protein
VGKTLGQRRVGGDVEGTQRYRAAHGGLVHDACGYPQGRARRYEPQAGICVHFKHALNGIQELCTRVMVRPAAVAVAVFLGHGADGTVDGLVVAVAGAFGGHRAAVGGKGVAIGGAGVLLAHGLTRLERYTIYCRKGSLQW